MSGCCRRPARFKSRNAREIRTESREFRSTAAAGRESGNRPAASGNLG